MTRPASESASYGPKPSATPSKHGGFAWAQIDAALSAIGASVRADVVRRFRDGGGSFARGARRDAELLCDAMTAAEDALEVAANGRTSHARGALRTIRRRLERELWP